MLHTFLNSKLQISTTVGLHCHPRSKADAVDLNEYLAKQ